MYSKDQIIKQLYQNEIILRKGPDYPDGFKLKSGKQSDIYINLRNLIKRPNVFNLIMYCMAQKLIDEYDKKGACILGIPTMGAVISPILAYKASLPQVVIRQKAKDHGVGRDIEGQLTDRIALVDDVITSGTSINEILAKYIEPRFGTGYSLNVFVVIDREQHNLNNVHSLATLTEIKEYEPEE